MGGLSFIAHSIDRQSPPEYAQHHKRIDFNPYDIHKEEKSMIVASVVLSCVGLLATLGVGFLVYCRTKKTISKVSEGVDLVSDAILYTFPGVGQRKRLLDDIRRTGEIRGEVVEKTLGGYRVLWRIPGQEKW